MRNYTKLILSFCCFIFVWPIYLYFSQESVADSQKSATDQKNHIDSQPSSKNLKINIISKKNGVGLSQDVEILQTELTKIGHEVQFIVESEFRPLPKVDINIFNELGDLSFLLYAKKNYFIPNPEWCGYSTEELLKFDKILCKTKESERIFKSINPNTVYMGFTSIDRWKESVPKNFKSFLHLSGASIQKGTESLIKTWVSNPQFPTLLLIRHRGNNTLFPPVSNINLIEQYLNDSVLKDYQNQCGCHICPSLTEGFGHYINEALSCESVVITTDAPPMNELVTDKRCLVPFHLSGPWRYSTCYYADPQKLEYVVDNICSMSDEELKEIGRKNRALYLENDRLFKQRMGEIFNSDSIFSSQAVLNKTTNGLNQNTWDVIAEKWKELFKRSPVSENPQPDHKTVLLAILARNKAHVLDKYLKCISNLDYDKKLITIYIKTDNNSDQTKEILQNWAKNNETLYRSIIFDSSDTSDTQKTNPHEWNPTRFKVLATIRNNSLLKAKEYETDFYFVVDCDNFIAPSTLRDLISKDKPIIAPYLRSIPEPNDLYANFFYKANETGFFEDHPNLLKILDRSIIGTFKVDVVHCTYLIKSECIDKLNYIDGTNDYEFIIFSRTARKNNVDQYICNEKEYGVQIHYNENLTLEEEKRRIYPILTMP